MPNPPNNSGIRDNHRRGVVAEFLRSKVKAGSRLSVVSAYFTIYAYDKLKEELDRLEHLDFLFGEPSFVNRLDPNKTEKKSFIIDADGLELANKLQQKRVAKECAEWIEHKVEIRTIRQSNLLHGKMYHVATAGVEDAIMGSSNFTVRGLGLGNGDNNIELNLIVDGNRDRQDLKLWFDELWNNPKLVKDVKQDVLNYLKQLYENNTPEFIYYKTLFHIFEKFLGDTGKTDAELGQTSLFETGIWKALFEFQKDGAKGAINKILRHNGCIIADSVGLGKTYEALAVMKYFELKNERILVLCPKKLRDNWTVYKSNSLLNPFVSDRFRFDVVSHTDLSRDAGYSGDINLATLNWGNYDLIVIDESHNFRNNTPGKRDDEGNLIRKSRYQRLMDDIIKAGVRTKVLLLSATPVNNDLKDLRNQLYFLTENRDDAFAESLGIGSLKETLATAQKVFSIWAKKQSAERKTGELLEKLNAAFFKLLDELTIARSRKHIQKYYKATIAQLGGFPKREKPVSIYPEIDLRGRFLSYDKLNDEIAGYKLSLFNPSRFVMEAHKAEYEKKGAFPFTQGQRETFLIGMMKVNFLKRLESSVKSFEITMERTIAKIEGLEKKIKNFQALPKQNPESEELELELDDPGHDEELEDAMQVGGKLKFRLNHLRLDGDDGWLKALKRDKDQLRILYNAAQDVSPDTDAKLAELKKLIAAKVAQPTTNKLGEPNRKVLVFTAFADTATYLYESLLAWGTKELGISMALVCGGGDTRATFGESAYDQILTNFSPRAKHRAKIPSMPQAGEIDLLIATDCISEGQNLQDCDYLINYDIHWNPVRIIQRFGRIDRIGSASHAVQLVNFWPTDDLNKYINLKNRVEVVYPSKRDRMIHLGRVEGPYLHDPKTEPGYPNSRAVKWLKEVPRTSFSQGALYEIGSALSLFLVRNYADEFRAALEGKANPPTPVAQDESVAAVAEDIEETTRDFVLKQLAQELKGHPFAEFVAHLMNTMGYRTRVSPAGPDGGIDIVAHKDELGFEPPIIKVQVKSSEGSIGDPAVSALYGKVGTGEFGLLVTLGTFTAQAANFAKSKSNLRLIDGDELVNLIFQHYDQFDSRYKGLLPLRRVYVPEVIEADEE